MCRGQKAGHVPCAPFRAPHGPAPSGDLRSALAGVLLVGQLAEELVALRGPAGVLLHHLLEELRDVVVAAVLGVPDVLAVVVPGLQRVVLDRDQVVHDVAEAGFTRRHSDRPSASVSGPGVFPSAHLGMPHAGTGGSMYRSNMGGSAPPTGPRPRALR